MFFCSPDPCQHSKTGRPVICPAPPISLGHPARRCDSLPRQANVPKRRWAPAKAARDGGNGAGRARECRLNGLAHAEPGAAPALCGRRATASKASPPGCEDAAPRLNRQRLLPGLRLSGAVLVLATRPSPDRCPEPGAAPALCGRRAPPPRRHPTSDEAERPRNMAAKYF